MRRADVPGISNRFRLHLCFAGVGDDFFLCAGQFHPAQSVDFGSRNEIPRAERPFDGISRVWDRVDFRRDRSDESASNRRRTRGSSDRPKRSLVRYGFRSGSTRFQNRRGALPDLGPGRLSGSTYAGDCVLFPWVRKQRDLSCCSACCSLSWRCLKHID